MKTTYILIFTILCCQFTAQTNLQKIKIVKEDSINLYGQWVYSYFKKKNGEIITNILNDTTIFYTDNKYVRFRRPYWNGTGDWFLDLKNRTITYDNRELIFGFGDRQITKIPKETFAYIKLTSDTIIFPGEIIEGNDTVSGLQYYIRTK